MKHTLLIISIVLAAIASLSAGSVLPDFKLKDTKNEYRTFDDIRGEKITVIDFWATWCGPCKRAFPKLNDLYENYRAKGVTFIGLNVDSPRNTPKVAPYARSNKIKYMVLLDPNGDLASQLNITSIPTLLIVNAEREIIFRHTGYAPGDEKLIEQEILKALEIE